MAANLLPSLSRGDSALRGVSDDCLGTVASSCVSESTKGKLYKKAIAARLLCEEMSGGGVKVVVPNLDVDETTVADASPVKILDSKVEERGTSGKGFTTGTLLLSLHEPGEESACAVEKNDTLH